MDDLTGQIGIIQNGNTWIAQAIEWFTRSHTHHVVIAYTPHDCVSAEPGGVHDRTNTAYTNIVWSRFHLTPTQQAGIVAACKASEKLPYNYAVYPFLAISRLTHIPVPHTIAAWLERRRNVDCSQLAAQIYAAAGIHLFTQEPDIVTPGDMERLFHTRGWA